MATVSLWVYVFVEEPNRLRVLESAGEYATRLTLSGLLALGGVGGTGALLVLAGPADAGWWLLATGTPAVLGLWWLSRVIAKGRTLWLFDRESGELLHRGRHLRSLASITHLGFFGMEVPKEMGDGPAYYVWFAPKQGHRLVPSGAYGLRKDLLGFPSLKDASQAATILSAFLAVEVVSEVLD